ncbi:MAG: penicillin-binding protein 2 [Oscillatoria sp. SIO1A7]|nr:penicillin-binding protein 2 [Oscillatoria sp. SIO1A7]
MNLMESYSVSQKATTRTVGQSYQSLLMIAIVTLTLVGGLGSRLAYLQLVEGKYHQKQAEENRIRLVPKQPVRGNIFDRKSRILATSRLSHAVFVWPTVKKNPSWRAIVRRISQIINSPEEEILEKLEKVDENSIELVRVARNITSAQATAIEEYSDELPWVEVQAEAVRTYPNGSIAAHVLGYTGEVDAEALKKLKGRGYRLRDYIGQMGVEDAFQEKLRGKWGGQLVEVDSRGNILRVDPNKYEPAQAGQDVRLTLDLDLQKAAERALGYTKGAIVAIDPNDGAVLAMASRPTFDPNTFSQNVTEETWRQVQGVDFPFVNRAIRGFAPASTFKIVTTVAGIKSGKFPVGTVLPTYPYVVAGGIKFWDWNRAGFGYLGYEGAMAMSSDTFFYQIGRGIRGPKLIEWTRNFGFGEKTGIELEAEEDPGLVADTDWKQKQFGQGWFEGDTINMSIGQGYLLGSPLQVAVMFAVPANGGYKVKPHLLKDNEDKKKWRKSLNLSPETIWILRSGLRQVITWGTGKKMNVSTIPPFAGKTGTAEDQPRQSHTWFGAYAPLDNPEIVVVAFGQNSGGGGSTVAAPMVRRVLEDYFRLKRSQKKP